MAERLTVRARPGARRDGIVGLRGEAVKVAVTAAPEKGKANAAIEKVVAAALGVRKSQVRVVAGHTSRDKTLEIDGVDANAVRQLIERAQEIG